MGNPLIEILGMEKPERKKPGPKPKGLPLARQINFSVSADHYAWLQEHPSRSTWLAEIIEKERKGQP